MATFASIFARQSCNSSINLLRGNLRSNTRSLGLRFYTNARQSQRTSLNRGIGMMGVGLGLASLSWPIIHGDSAESATTAKRTRQGTATVAEVKPLEPNPPSSEVKLLELTFGSVCGICVGIFIKKGAKAVAFVLGGSFVLLQYLTSLSAVRVDWAKLGSRFENFFYTTDSAGVRRPPSVLGLWNWLADFLTADFQPRASFLAGLALGLRIG